MGARDVGLRSVAAVSGGRKFRQSGLSRPGPPGLIAAVHPPLSWLAVGMVFLHFTEVGVLGVQHCLLTLGAESRSMGWVVGPT